MSLTGRRRREYAAPIGNTLLPTTLRCLSPLLLVHFFSINGPTQRLAFITAVYSVHRSIGRTPRRSIIDDEDDENDDNREQSSRDI